MTREFQAPPFGHVDMDRWRELGYGDDYVIYLDGVKQTHVLEFHDVEKWAKRYVTNEQGHIVHDGYASRVERVPFKTLMIRHI